VWAETRSHRAFKSLRVSAVLMPQCLLGSRAESRPPSAPFDPHQNPQEGRSPKDWQRLVSEEVHHTAESIAARLDALGQLHRLSP